MDTIKRILVPVTFSDNCKGAIRYAQSIGEHFQSELTILHVAEPLEGMVGIDPPYAGAVDMMQSRRDRYREDLQAFCPPGPLEDRTRREVVEGDPGIEIVKYADRENVDLIVMPTHGYGPIRRFLVGSVTAKVLHDVKCPVWTGVHMEEAPVPDRLQVRTVACAVDLGLQTRAIICWSAEFAATWGASLRIFHVTMELPEAEWSARLESLARLDIKSHQDALPIASELHIAPGKVARTVDALAQDAHADLLVIGRSHRSGGGHLPSNTYAIIRGAPCPVISL
jgi:nucleotide-binding universal stress UspA family protein